MRFSCSSVLRCCLIAALLLFAGVLAAAPIALTQPLDLRGKRVLIVAELGDSAGAHYVLPMNARGWKKRFERTPEDLQALRVDEIVADEARARLQALDVADAEVLRVEYPESALYDKDGELIREKVLDALAQQLLATHHPDALLLLTRGGIRWSQYGPTSYGYGMAFSPTSAGAFAAIQARLYVPQRKNALVVRYGWGSDRFEGVVPDDRMRYDPPALWPLAREMQQVMLGRVTRSIVAETLDRALRPRASATSTWSSIYSPEKYVFTNGR